MVSEWGVVLVDGVPYVTRWDEVGWWLWRLVPRFSPEYFIDAELTYCTCPSDRQPCKHLLAMRELNRT